MYSKWKLRYYNELDHHFDERMKKAQDCATDYMSQFHSKIFETIAKLLVFLLSSFFTILIIFSINTI